jgi:hypothetical protein
MFPLSHQAIKSIMVDFLNSVCLVDILFTELSLHTANQRELSWSFGQKEMCKNGQNCAHQKWNGELQNMLLLTMLHHSYLQILTVLPFLPLFVPKLM